MFGAIYIGLSGLNAYSRGLQQVSNNVTNLNTTGFRGSTVTFQNFYGAGDRGGLGYTATSHGSGNGVGIGMSRLDLTSGELRQTDRDLDLGIEGSGFLVLLDGEDTYYTRTGSFEVDNDGFIVLAGTDFRLATLDSSGHAVSLSVDAMHTNSPKASTMVKFNDNLSSTLDPAEYSVSDIKVYDASGALHVWTAAFERFVPATGDDAPPPPPANSWTVTLTDASGASVHSGLISYDAQGYLLDSSKTMAVTAGDGFAVTLDFSGTTSFSGGSVVTLNAKTTDGYGVGSLTRISVNDKGELELGYSNDQKVTLGAVALADFRDTDGLAQRSGGLFVYEGSGGRQLMTSEDPRVGSVLSKRLEASNVDLSKQFGDLILIQRGFQASSQIVSASNDMIQQLFGIRGQG